MDNQLPKIDGALGGHKSRSRKTPHAGRHHEEETLNVAKQETKKPIGFKRLPEEVKNFFNSDRLFMLMESQFTSLTVGKLVEHLELGFKKVDTYKDFRINLSEGNVRVVIYEWKNAHKVGLNQLLGNTANIERKLTQGIIVAHQDPSLELETAANQFSHVTHFYDKLNWDDLKMEAQEDIIEKPVYDRIGEKKLLINLLETEAFRNVNHQELLDTKLLEDLVEGQICPYLFVSEKRLSLRMEAKHLFDKLTQFKTETEDLKQAFYKVVQESLGVSMFGKKVIMLMLANSGKSGIVDLLLEGVDKQSEEINLMIADIKDADLAKVWCQWEGSSSSTSHGLGELTSETQSTAEEAPVEGATAEEEAYSCTKCTI